MDFLGKLSNFALIICIIYKFTNQHAINLSLNNLYSFVTSLPSIIHLGVVQCCQTLLELHTYDGDGYKKPDNGYLG